MKYLIVFFGSGIGGALRYATSLFVFKILPAFFPFGTLIVNFIGSVILGFVIYGLLIAN
jgi:CrcB protein